MPQFLSVGNFFNSVVNIFFKKYVFKYIFKDILCNM